MFIFKKIRKHSLIFNRIIRQKSTLNQISAFENKILDEFVESFQEIRKSKFTQADFLAFERCEHYRKKILADRTKVSYDIFGTDKTAIISNVCKKATSKKKWCRLLYLITSKLEIPTVLEMGTNLGVSGSYIIEGMRGKHQAKFITMEAMKKFCEISQKQFSSIESDSQFEIIEGLYEYTFPILLKKEARFNLIFIDGNHREDPTVEYFNRLKEKLKYPAIFIFDDINWSAGMKRAWSRIKSDSQVNYSIDLFEQGIVILDAKDPCRGQHFSLHLAY